MDAIVKPGLVESIKCGGLFIFRREPVTTSANVGFLEWS